MMVPKKHPDGSTYAGRFAIHLYQLRQKAGLTADQVAKTLEVSTKTIYAWESGTNFPHVSIYEKIAELYKIKKVKDLLPNE